MEQGDWRYGQGIDGPRTSRVDMSSIPRDFGVESLPQTVESLEKIKSHPTISKDWTNQATVDNNLLVSLQKNKFVPQSNKRRGREIEPQGNNIEELSAANLEGPGCYKYQRLRGPSSTTLQQQEVTIQQEGLPTQPPQLTPHQMAQQHRQAMLQMQAQQQPAQQARAIQGQPTQDQGLYLDYSSSEDEDYMESPNSENYRSAVSNDLPHSSYMAGLRKARRSQRRRPCLQQLYGQDETTSWSPLFSETYKNDYELKKANALDRSERRTRSRVKVQSSGPYSCKHSHPAPISRRQSPQKSIKTEGLDNNIPVQQSGSDLEKLKKENVHLKSRLREPLPRLQVVYRVSRRKHRSGGVNDSDIVTDMYLDKPQLMEGDQGMASLQGQLPIFRLDSYLERHPKISVIVFQDTSDENLQTEAGDGVLNVSWSESILVTSRKLMKSLEILVRRLSSSLGCSISLDLTGSKTILPAPYLPFYHYLEKLREYAADLAPKATQEWKLLVEYIEYNYGDQYREVDKMLAAGTISQEFIPYLIKDGDIIVQRDSHGHSAYVATSPPIVNVPRDKRRNNGLAQHLGLSSRRRMDVNVSLHSGDLYEWEIGTEFWLFDGNFEKRRGTTVLKISGRREESLAIKDLEIYPIKYADPDLEINMKMAGLELWKSRSRRYVSYRSGQAETDTKSSKPRYMIDPATYKKLQPKDGFTYPLHPLRDDLGLERMSAEEPPADPFLLLLPRTINGFNMHNKKWEELEVARISEVSWNKEAFESLVVEPTTKILIKALVMHQLEKEKGTDLIAGKGQGLIVLLHGGPGTGKTFTAETVAEIAEKPLYRVTCGDLGTEPTKVETLLESVLYLGKTWDCVVLLDEADVYLEERSMESLARNALVSVFLRVLEYYEGILILTSNRVGTFDESFKSRIQLALHYEKLKVNDRRAIWENFIRRLQKVEEVGIDYDDINKHIDDLARNELNGRQIRNVITTARQFARHLGKDLDYADLQQVVKIALKFDKHTMEMQGGMNDDARKREEGIRP